LLVFALALFLIPLAAAAVLPPTPNPLPGSRFQGADGNQDDTATLLDWQGFQGAGRVGHTSDPNAQDSAFAGGSKENEPGNWALTTDPDGVNPGSANILDLWTAADLDGPNIFSYLGFARADAGGTSYMTFEVNHDSRLWHNGQAMIPCRRDGDLLVSYQAQGNDVDVVLQEWVTTAADLATGCATHGRLDAVGGLTPNDDAQGAVNPASIAARLPGYYDGNVPVQRFGEAALNLSQILDDAPGIDPCFAFASVWMHSRSSTADAANMQDYVAPRAISLHSCSASGTKFHDLNGNGRRDSGEPGLSNWIIWADYDDDGVRDSAEPYAYTDAEGQYVINDIRPPDGTYMLRETLPTAAARRRAARAGVFCSFPNATTPGGTGSAPGGQFHCGWGPIRTADTTWARGRDFGNFQPARLTVQKELYPSDAAGRFNLMLNGVVVVPSAGDGAGRTMAVRPGTYTVSEAAAAGTNPADYTPTVDCKPGTRRAQRRSSAVYTLTVASAETWVCKFRNVRMGAPAIAIDKTGPATATAGDTLRYTLYVTNPGSLPFPAASVRVADPNCDSAPELVGKSDGAGADGTPATLDPGDTWTYACSRKTSAPENCEPSTVPNTATVAGTADGTTVTDSSSISTRLKCPPPTPEPTPPPPGPPPAPQPPPSPIEPPGPVLPDADDPGTAGILFRRATRGCIPPGRVPRVVFAGTRVATVRVYVNGRLDRRLTVRSLQTRLTPRVRSRPGTRLRLRVVVTFQRGTDSPPVTFRDTVEICAAGRAPPRPAFTG
jgi:hypothetical protein